MPSYNQVCEINFTKTRGSIVYVIYAVKDEKKVAFYVGESERGIARIADYINAYFGASTDFKVGRTAQLLEKKGYEIIVEMQNVEDRKAKEKELIAKYSDSPLLNQVEGYNYKTTTEEEYLPKLESYVCKNFAT